MLRYALRRLFWAIPTLFGISVVAYLLTTLIPEPPPEPLATQLAMLERDPASFDAYEESRRERLLDLPRFVNSQPRDVRTAATESVAHIVANDVAAPLAAHRLARLGGAVLPFVLPELDQLEPAARSRVALALAPIADRMGQGEDARVRDPQLAAAFWTQFWQDRSIEFTGPAVARAVARLVQRATTLREQDLRAVDTFALPEVIEAMRTTTDPGAIGRLAEVASSVTGRDIRVPDEAASASANDVARNWLTWWSVHRTEYTAVEGGERVAASLSETRYGKWMLSASRGEFGVSVRDGEPILRKLRASAPVTLALTLVSLLLSYLIAIPLGVIGASRRGERVDMAMAAGMFLFYSAPTFFLAQILLHTAPEASGFWRLIFAVLTMTAGSVATLSRFQRASMLDVLHSDYVRTARAKGLPKWRVLVVHALRNAIVPTVTLAGLQLPLLFGGAIVVEEVFRLPGAGFETMRAVEAHDASWLVMVVLFTALATMVGLLASDVAHGLLDPRVRERLLRREDRT